ncbi:MAG: hypothetical protein JSU69_01305, partial [Candidatus Zixiibacteriota bacterium]
LGTEYLFNTSIGEVPVRFGFRNEAYPEGNIHFLFLDSTRSLYLFGYAKNRTTGLSFSLGSGIHWSQILLDFAYTYTTYDQEIYEDLVLRSENNWKNHHLNFTFTGYF